MTEITVRVNGQTHQIAVDDPNTPLLYALRDDPLPERQAENPVEG